LLIIDKIHFELSAKIGEYLHLSTYDISYMSHEYAPITWKSQGLLP